MKLSIREAFALEPVLHTSIGGTEFHVPPLTFGRFQDLFRGDFRKVLECLGLVDYEALGALASNLDVISKLAEIDVADLYPFARAVVPGMTPEAWKTATVLDVVALFSHFVVVHDWTFIAEETGLLKDDEPRGPTAAEFEGVLLLIAEELGCRIDEPLNYRLEGFFTSVAAIRARRRMREEARAEAEREHEGWEGSRPADSVVPIVANPDAAANIHRLMADADARAVEGSAPRE